MNNKANSGSFKKGQHWRKPQPYWEKAWLEREYLSLRRSASDIARALGLHRNAILFWLAKHEIPRRDTSEVRAVQHWSLEGAANGMHGKCGVLNPNWNGGTTPLRQSLYASYEWKKVSKQVRQRDRFCRLCESLQRLQIHHIISLSEAPLLAFTLWNLIRLCYECHKKLRGKEKKWEKRLLALTLGNGGHSVRNRNGISKKATA